MNLDSIVQFQKAGGHTVAYVKDNYTPTIKERGLRLKLIFEELGELADAYGMQGTFSELCEGYVLQNQELSAKGYILKAPDTLDFNKVEALDALSDLSVVVNGGYCISGFTDIFDAAYNETMRSNLSKFPKTLDEALASVAGKTDWEHREVDLGEGKKCFVILRKEDGKIMKPVGYFKPDYSKLLDGSKTV